MDFNFGFLIVMVVLAILDAVTRKARKQRAIKLKMMEEGEQRKAEGETEEQNAMPHDWLPATLQDEMFAVQRMLGIDEAADESEPEPVAAKKADRSEPKEAPDVTESTPTVPVRSREARPLEVRSREPRKEVVRLPEAVPVARPTAVATPVASPVLTGAQRHSGGVGVTRVRVHAHGFALRSKGALRRAIVAREVLGPPVALRDGEAPTSPV